MVPRELGKSEIWVYPIGLGGMPMSIQKRPGPGQSIRTICSALDAGINFIDTADVYCMDHSDIGHNERLIVKGIREWRESSSVIIATKGGMERPNGAWTTNGRPEHLKAACEASLNALEVDCISLYQLHAPDDDVPFSESVGALRDLQQEGKIQHVGLSNVSVPQIKEAQKIVEIVSVQNECNLYEREAFDTGVVSYCETQGIAFLAYSPVGGHRKHQRVLEDKVLRGIAQAHNASPYQVALAWLLAKSPVIIPIPGASRPDSARSSAEAAQLKLSTEEIARIDSESPV